MCPPEMLEELSPGRGRYKLTEIAAKAALHSFLPKGEELSKKIGFQGGGDGIPSRV